MMKPFRWLKNLGRRPERERVIAELEKTPEWQARLQVPWWRRPPMLSMYQIILMATGVAALVL